MKWQALIWIAVMALVSVGVAEASPESTHVKRALSPSAFGEHLAEQAGADHRMDWKEPGVARLQAPMQDLVAEIDRLGLSLISDSKDEPGQLRLQPVRVGRGTQRHPIGAGQVSMQGSLVRLSRPGLIEEFRSSSQGIRQDFVLQERLPGSTPLRLELQLVGATAELHEEGVRLRLDASGRELDYGRLLITDATGQALSGHFEVMGEHLLVIQVQDTTARYPIRIDPTFTDSQWQSIAAPFADGVNDNIFALAWDSANGHLYAGGDFTTAAGVAANRVARWDGSQWERLSGGVNNTVLALAWDSASGHLYAGGTFTTASGVAVNGIARWDGTNWTALGSGVITRQVWALAWDGANGHLYAGGPFSTAGGVPAEHIARWDGSAWSALGTGLNDSVLALAWDGANGHLYAGGRFFRAGTIITDSVARWDGSAWSALGLGTNNEVRALAWDATNGELYAGGVFTTAGGAPADRVARWDGTAWSALGLGVDSFVFALAWDNVNGHLYVGGDFTTAGGAAASRMARWDGSVWSALGTGMNGFVRALAWDGASGDLYSGGFFTDAGGLALNRAARWDGTAWSALGSGVSSEVHALAWDGANGHLYAGTTFITGGGIVFSHIIRWDGSAWSALGSGMDSPVLALAWDGVNGHLYAGGEFTTAGGIAASRIARWDGSAWSTLGLGVNNEVRDLAWNGASGDLYAGGTFTMAGGAPAGSIARWDGSAWSALGSGTNGLVNALAWDGANGHLYTGGIFTTAGGVPAFSVARWDGSAWSSLASGTGGGVRALAWDDANGHLYVGGTFIVPGVLGADNIARWDGSAWSALGSGMNALVTTLAWDGTNEHLFAGGPFDTAGRVAANRIACWDGTGWVPLGSGTIGEPLALVWDSANGHLYAGGTFTSAGNQPARVARANLGVAFATATDGMGNGDTTGSTPDGAYFGGTPITLVATPDADSDFAGWSPAICVDGFSLGGPTTCTATFTLRSYAFATATAGTGSGSTAGSTPNGTYDHGTPISLVATPAPNSEFTGWMPAGCVDGFSLEADTTCTATFTLRNYAFATATAGTGNGSTAGSTGDGTYDHGTPITLVATPDADSDFAGWSPATCVDGFSLEADTTCTAEFTLRTYAFATATTGAGAGSTAGSTADGTYDQGTPITLVATPDVGSDFAGWSPASCVDGFSLEANTTCTATFTLRTYTFATATTGTGSGSTAGSTADGAYDQGTPITLVATPDADSDFAGWSPATCVDGFSLEADTNCTAEFTLRTYAFATATTGTGSGSTAGTTADGAYDHGTPITLAATPDAGSDFAGWSPATCVDGFSLEADTTCTAEFTLRTYTFATATTGTGSGSTAGSTADGAYDQGTPITLVATPDADSDFAGWSPATCVDGFSLEADTNCTAEFTLRTYAFATATTGTGSGSTAGSTADGTYDQGTPITLVATPDAGSDFAGWSPATCVDGFSLEADTTCTAEFTPRTYPIVTEVIPSGSGTVTCSPNPVAPGANASCTATANFGFVFDQFSGDCVGLTCDLNNVAAPQTVTAEFIIEDFDGVPADIENAGPNLGDGNDDGILDAEQSDVASLPAAHGGGYLSVELSGACSQLHEVQTSGAITPDPAGYAYPLGLLGFSLPCETATVTVLYHGIGSLAGLTYRKHGPNPPGSASSIWYSLPGAEFGTTSVSGETVATATFDLADNAIGDATGDDGQIVDPGGPGSLLTEVPTLGPLGLVILALLIGAAGISIRRRSG